MLIRFRVIFTHQLTELNGITFETNAINHAVILLEGFRDNIKELYCSYHPELNSDNHPQEQEQYKDADFWAHAASLQTNNMDWCPEIREIKELDKNKENPF